MGAKCIQKYIVSRESLGPGINFIKTFHGLREEG